MTKRRLQAILQAAALLVIASSIASAEVSISHENGALLRTQVIVDDPDPISVAWVPHSAPGTRVLLNPEGAANGDGPPSVLIHKQTRVPIVSWARNSGQGYDVVVSTFQNGSWTPAQVIAGAAVSERDPQLVMDPDDGRVHLVYWVNDAVPYVVHRWAPADLSAWSAPQTISTPGQPSLRPSVIFDGDDLVVAYEHHTLGAGTTPRQIMLATSTENGWAHEVIETTSHDGPNWPRVHRKGTLLWIDWVDGEDCMSWRRRDAQGVWESTLEQTFQGAEERDYHVRGQIRMQATE